MNDEELKSLWQSQPVMTTSYSFAQLERDAGEFRRKIVRRNLQESIAALMVILIFGFYAWNLSEPFMRIGSALMVLGSIVILYQLQRRASIRQLPPESLALPYVIYLRQELVRQRDALRSVWLWYICPIVPGMSLFFWGMAQPEPADFPWPVTAVIIVPFVVVVAMNFLTARKLQHKIDQLDQLSETTQNQPPSQPAS